MCSKHKGISVFFQICVSPLYPQFLNEPDVSLLYLVLSFYVLIAAV